MPEKTVTVGSAIGLHARPAVDLRDLPLDPHGTEPVDPAGDRVGDLPHRCRLLGGGLQGHGGHPR